MRKIINTLFVGLLGGLLIVGTAYAHAAYLRSQPGADAIIAAPPARVEIWFEQELFRKQGQNSILVTGPDGTVVSTGETIMDDDDRKHIWVELHAELPAGIYKVEWKNVSLEDGHPSTGSFSFTLDPQAAVTSTPMLELPASEDTNLTTATPIAIAVTATTIPETSGSTGPCAAGMLPMFGLIGVLSLKRSHKK